MSESVEMIQDAVDELTNKSKTNKSQPDETNVNTQEMCLQVW